ncbi:MAG: ATP-binding protein [Anaerolineae bacterium]
MLEIVADKHTNAVELHASQVRRTVDPARLPFNSTAEVAPLEGIIGQPRALDAIEFGLEVAAPGYNLFVAGSPGSGRETTIRAYLERYAPTRPAPPDWVYVHNFAEPYRPMAIELPPGRGAELARRMNQFVDGAQREISRAFDSEDYERRKGAILSEMSHRRDAVFTELQTYAHENSFALEQTPVGVASIPLVDGHALSVQEFERLPEEKRTEFEQKGEALQAAIAGALRQVRQIEQETLDQLRGLERDVAMFAVGPLLEDLKEKFADCPKVLAYLDSVLHDLPEHLQDFRPKTGQEGEGKGLEQIEASVRQDDLVRYRVNVLVDHGATDHAPVIIEANPTYYNLTGRIDYQPTFGAMVTNFHQIKPGALHRANGGFLLVRVVDVLAAPFAWDALKRALISREIRIENLGEQYTALPTTSLRPEPIPLNLKVVLIGTPQVYSLLYQLDEDFQELFKVKADFAPDMAWTDDHTMNYAAFISRRVADYGLRHFDRTAVARVVEYGARLREDQRKLSTRLLDVADVVTEASFWAARADHDLVTADDVEQAIAKREYRSNWIAERILEMMADGSIVIDTSGSRVGQVNGVAVLDLGDFAFGRPSRITARTFLGHGSILSIERETQLSGPIHNKGFLILSGYLAGQYAQEDALALGATLTFEQGYEGVEGDSASVAELIALLSSLADAEVNQAIAVTGSVNQYGQVQAVGGVTQKIEGFFEVCRATELTGRQGVIIPAANVPQLMLKHEVAQAIEDGRFHVWAVHTIDEAMALVTGLPAGERGADGKYPEGSLHRRVQDKLRSYAEKSRRSSESENVRPRRMRRLRA